MLKALHGHVHTGVAAQRGGQRRNVRRPVAGIGHDNHVSGEFVAVIYVSLELEKKKRLSNTLKEKNENYNKMQEEINLLSANYKELQNKSLENSPLFKELTYLANKNKPRNDKPLITEKQWKLITDEITQIYPSLYKYIYSLCPDLSEQDFQYCCLYMYGFDTNTEAKLLNITVDSVRKRRLRLRRKLDITLPDNNATLYEYLIENIH